MFPKGVLAIVKESAVRTERGESTCTLQNADRHLPRNKADKSKSSGADPRLSQSSSAELKDGIACLADDVSDLWQALEELQEEVRQLQVKRSPLPDQVIEAPLLDHVSTLAKEVKALKLEHEQALRQEMQLQKEDQIEQAMDGVLPNMRAELDKQNGLLQESISIQTRQAEELELQRHQIQRQEQKLLELEQKVDESARHVHSETKFDLKTLGQRQDVQHLQDFDTLLHGQSDTTNSAADHRETSESHNVHDVHEPCPNLEHGKSIGGHFTDSRAQNTERAVIDCGRDLHTWCIVHAAKHIANPCWALSLMMLSIGFIALQLFLLASCVLESSFTRCSRHDHCELGEWCSPALAGTFSTAPGVCFDCWSAQMFYNARFLNAPYEVYPDPYELMADAAGDKWLIDGSSHCNATDTQARRCDYLVNNLQNITPLSMLIFVAMAGLITASLVDELDQIEGCELLSWDRLIVVSREKHKYIIMALSWFACSLRRWVMPMMTVGACLGLVLRQPLSASNLLLNGVSISFVTSLDDTLISLIYFPYRNTEDPPVYPTSVRTWLFHRVYACFIFASFIASAMKVEGLLVEYGNEASYGAVCSDVREIVTVICCYVCESFACLHALLRLYLRFRSKEIRVPQKLSSKMSSLQLGEVGVPPNHMVWDVLQFFSELLIPPLLVWFFREWFVAQGPLVQLQIGDALNWSSE